MNLKDMIDLLNDDDADIREYRVKGDLLKDLLRCYLRDQIAIDILEVE